MGSGRRVRVGVIGAGSWAIANHIPILAARDDVELVSAVRTNRKALDLLRDRFGFSHVSDDYRDALEQDLDAVVVSSPAGLHYEHVKAALEAGADVLCEKPFTTEPEHAWELHDIATEQGRHLLLALGWNYRPTAIEAKRLMEDPGVGQIQHVLVAMASGLRGLLRGTGSYRGQDALFRPAARTWIDPRLSGGGYAPAALSHALGLAVAHRPARLPGLRLHEQRGRRGRPPRRHQRAVPFRGDGLDIRRVVATRRERGRSGGRPLPRHQPRCACTGRRAISSPTWSGTSYGSSATTAGMSRSTCHPTPVSTDVMIHPTC